MYSVKEDSFFHENTADKSDKIAVPFDTSEHLTHENNKDNIQCLKLLKERNHLIKNETKINEFDMKSEENGKIGLDVSDTTPIVEQITSSEKQYRDPLQYEDKAAYTTVKKEEHHEMSYFDLSLPSFHGESDIYSEKLQSTAGAHDNSVQEIGELEETFSKKELRVSVHRIFVSEKQLSETVNYYGKQENNNVQQADNENTKSVNGVSGGDLEGNKEECEIEMSSAINLNARVILEDIDSLKGQNLFVSSETNFSPPDTISTQAVFNIQRSRIISPRHQMENEPEESAKPNFGRNCSSQQNTFHKPDSMDYDITSKSCSGNISSVKNSVLHEATSLIKLPKSHEFETVYKCQQCAKFFKSEGNLKRHLIFHYGSRSCKVCSKHCSTLSNFKMHMHTHSINKPYQCAKCNKYFKHKSVLRSHIKNLHSDINFYCDICFKKFPYRERLYKHIKNVHLRLSAKCYICGGIYANKSSLSDHMKHSHLKIEYSSCKICGKVVKARKLKEHEIIHFPEKRRKLTCNECGKNFTTKYYLVMHLNLHAGIKPYECKECKSRFTQKSHLTSHSVTHSERLPFTCNHCGRGFKLKHYLTSHLLVHHNSQFSECTMCDKKYNSKQGLRVHIKSKHTKRESWPNICTYCGRRFPTTRGFKRHLKMHNK